MNVPIDHWSYSSMSSLLGNPLQFRKKYILKVYDSISGPSAVVGSAGHKALEMYYKGLDVAPAIAEGMKYIDGIADIGINYGKTGSRAKIIETYTKAINAYFAELPSFHEVLAVEEAMTEEIDSQFGGVLPLPAKAKMDMVTRNKLGQIEVVDHKFVTSYTDGSVDNFRHWLQAMFDYYIVQAKYGEAPARIIFNECKVSTNRDGLPQIQPYVMEMTSAADFATFEKLYNDCTKLIGLEGMLYLPNPNDLFDGQDSFELYRAGISGVEAPVPVQHKTAERTYVEKAYVPSAADKIENKNLSPEEKIRLKLAEFGLAVEMQETHIGPSITQYTMKPSRAMAMTKFAKMGNDLALALEVHSLRVDAPIPGTGLIGVEVPSTVRKTVELSQQHYHKGTMDIPIGVDVFGQVLYRSLADMPHLLIAGATGAGKSVMLNTIIKSLTSQMAPEAMQLILIDPKRVELSGFRNLPHLLFPISYEMEEATDILELMVGEMNDRYKILEDAGVRSVSDYTGNMPRIVIVLDEFADLLMSGDRDTAERMIVRIAQKARAVGIHLILATQRPSADVVTGLIKANMPCKIAFTVSTQVNSRIILDVNGAEQLTGKGDMLYTDPGIRGLRRLQGLYS